MPIVLVIGLFIMRKTLLIITFVLVIMLVTRLLFALPLEFGDHLRVPDGPLHLRKAIGIRNGLEDVDAMDSQELVRL